MKELKGIAGIPLEMSDKEIKAFLEVLYSLQPLGNNCLLINIQQIVQWCFSIPNEEITITKDKLTKEFIQFLERVDKDLKSQKELITTSNYIFLQLSITDIKNVVGNSWTLLFGLNPCFQYYACILLWVRNYLANHKINLDSIAETLNQYNEDKDVHKVDVISIIYKMYAIIYNRAYLQFWSYLTDSKYKPEDNILFNRDPIMDSWEDAIQFCKEYEAGEYDDTQGPHKIAYEAVYNNYYKPQLEYYEMGLAILENAILQEGGNFNREEFIEYAGNKQPDLERSILNGIESDIVLVKEAHNQNRIKKEAAKRVDILYHEVFRFLYPKKYKSEIIWEKEDEEKTLSNKKEFTQNYNSFKRNAYRNILWGK